MAGSVQQAYQIASDMPKKGKGKKKGGKGKEKKDDGPPPPKVSAEEEPLNELSRQFYLIQIKDLEGRVGRYQERCATLQVSNDELQAKLGQQEEDQGQVIQFLKKKASIYRGKTQPSTILLVLGTVWLYHCRTIDMYMHIRRSRYSYTLIYTMLYYRQRIKLWIQQHWRENLRQ